MKRQMMAMLVLLIITALSGCSSLNSSFDCPMKPGIRCESLDQVNARVDRGDIDQSNINLASISSHISPLDGMAYHSHFKDSSLLAQHQPLRYQETVMRVWIAPYEDTTSNYHQESEVYTVVNPGRWIGYPPKEANIED
jgi:hypothetical protein